MVSPNKKQLNQLLSTIENRLVEYIPNAIAKLRINSPASALYIWFHDLTVDDVTPEYAIGTKEFFDAVRSGLFDSQIGGDVEDCLRRPQQCATGPMPGFPLPSGVCDVVEKEVAMCYSILVPNEETFFNVDESELLAPIRSLMKRLQFRLQAYDWTKVIQISDEFSVIVSDYIGFDDD